MAGRHLNLVSVKLITNSYKALPRNVSGRCLAMRHLLLPFGLASSAVSYLHISGDTTIQSSGSHLER